MLNYILCESLIDLLQGGSEPSRVDEDNLSNVLIYYRAVATHRGWIKKIKFAPGRGNMKLLVLFNDGADIWDTKEVA